MTKSKRKTCQDSSAKGFAEISPSDRSPPTIRTKQVINQVPSSSFSTTNPPSPDRVGSRMSFTEEEDEEEEDEDSMEETKAATDILRNSKNGETRAMGTLLEKILDNQKSHSRRIKTLEKAVDEVQGRLNEVIDVTEFIQNKMSKTERSVSSVERELVRLEREINDSFIVISGIPEVDGEDGGKGGEKTKEVASAVLIDGGFVDLAKKVISAWRPKPSRNQRQASQNAGRIIMVKFETLQARKKIMGSVRNLPPSTNYPQRKFYPKRSPLELRGQYRLKPVMEALIREGWKIDKKWGGFSVEGGDRVYMPLDFLPSTIVINGQSLDIDKMQGKM
jgi:hypothetical protein